MKKCWISIWGVLLLTTCAYTQVFHAMLSAGYNNTVAGSKKFEDVPSFLINQSSLSGIKNVSAVAYSEKRYLLKELSAGSVAIAFPVRGGGMGIAAGLSGFNAYNESQFSIAYGKILGKSVSLGAQVSYNLVHIEGYGNAAAIGFEVGATIQLTDKLFTGLHACNPAGGGFGHDSREKLRAIFTMAFGYEVSDHLLLSIQMEKTEYQPVDIRFGLHYAFAPQFFIRAGTAVSSGKTFAGFGLSWKNMRMDITANYHLQLGFTPGLQFIVQIQKGEE